jgi:hypothetical protein
MLLNAHTVTGKPSANTEPSIWRPLSQTLEREHMNFEVVLHFER